MGVAVDNRLHQPLYIVMDSKGGATLVGGEGVCFFSGTDEHII